MKAAAEMASFDLSAMVNGSRVSRDVVRHCPTKIKAALSPCKGAVVNAMMRLVNLLALPISALLGMFWLFMAASGIGEWWRHQRKAVRAARGDSKAP